MALIMVLALSLRLYGLFDGLEQGHVYHPDTPKQVAAAARFMHGTFFQRTGVRACDGYPYFNSLLCATLRAPYFWGMKWIHRHSPEQVPHAMTFEFMRIVNALESTLAVLLLYWLVLTLIGHRAAIGAGLLLAVSPIDIVACHSANGDTASALFGLLALLFAIRIYRHGATRAYILATLFAMCSFSSKYYGAAAAVPVILAHLLRCFVGRRHEPGSFWIPVATMGLTALAAFFITNPGAITHPVFTMEDMHAVMKYTASFNTGMAYSGLPIHVRFWKTMILNIPGLVLVFGPVVCIAAALLTLSLPFQRRMELWLIAAGPLFYIVVGLTMKPAIQTVYHVLIAPSVIICAVLAIDALFKLRTPLKISQVIAVILFLVCLAPLANAGWREALLFKLPDTRVLAANWMENNVPTAFSRSGSKYSLYAPNGPQADEAMGIAWMRSDFREPVMPGDPRIFRIDLEPEDRLTVFRNLPTEIWCNGTNDIRADFTTPYAYVRPATNTHELIVADTPLLVRTDRRIEFSGTIRRTIFSTTRLETAFLLVHATPGSHVSAKVNGYRLHLDTDADGFAEASCDGLRPEWPRLAMGYLYRLSASSDSGSAMLHIAFDSEEAGAVREQFTGSNAAPRLTDAEFYSRYGISRAYVDALLP